MSVARVAPEFREIPIGLIDAPILPSRASMDDERMDWLVSDIRQQGVLQPLSVGRVGERYETIAGHRRLIAAGRAGLVTVPCLVYPSVTAASERVKFAENYGREDLNPADEAIYFAEVLERDHGGDTDRLASAFNLTRAYVESRLNLLHSGEEILGALQRGEIGIGVAQELARFKDPLYRRGMLKQAILGGATRTTVAAWFADYQKSLGPLGEQPTVIPDSPIVGAGAPETFFRCYCCGKTDNVHTMRPVNLHEHCRLAIVDPLLVSYRGES